MVFNNMKHDEDTEYIHGYKIKLYPNPIQAEFIEDCVNVNRYVYNWALDKEIKAHENGERFLSMFDLTSMLTQHRRETPWLQRIPNTTCRSGIIDLINAYNMYFKDTTHTNKPRFKSKKHEETRSFHTRNERVYFRGTKIGFEGCGYVETKIDVSEFSKKKIHTPVIVKDKLGDCFITFSVIEKKPILDVPKSEVIGIDLNKKNYFALSNGKIYKAPEEKIKRLQKGISDYKDKVHQDNLRHNELEKANPGEEIFKSRRAEKRMNRYLKRNKKLTNVVENNIHNITKDIIKTNPAGVVMEDLDVNKLKQNHFVAQNIHNYSFGKCKEIMQKKCIKYNIPFKLSPSNYPSTQICSNCGNVQEMPLNKKIYKCNICGMEMDRDINAAKNLASQFNKL